jgi:hypothetical protein
MFGRHNKSGASWRAALKVSRQIDRRALEIGERAVTQRAFMGRAQHHARRLAGLECFLPARRAQAPAVAGLEAGKAIFRHRGREIVAARFGEFEKLRRRDDTDGVTADVVDPGVAAAVPVETGQRRQRAGLDRLAEHVAGRAAPTLATASVVPEHSKSAVYANASAFAAQHIIARASGEGERRC